MSQLTPGMTRFTRQRGELLALLAETDEFRSPQQLHAQLRSRGANVGLTTVYRTVQVLHEAGEIDATRMPGGDLQYRRCGAAHHHHLVCRECGTTIEVKGPAVERWADDIGARHGFVDVAHTLEIFGVCARCSRPG